MIVYGLMMSLCLCVGACSVLCCCVCGVCDVFGWLWFGCVVVVWCCFLVGFVVGLWVCVWLCL